MTTHAVTRKMMIVAAVLSVAGGLALVALGWWVQGWEHQASWSRLTDPSWWTGGIVRIIGSLAFSKLGFKLALAAVVGTVALLTWRRRRAEAGGEADPANAVGQDADRASRSG